METAESLAIEPGHRVAIMALSVILFGLVLELVRRDYLKERYALLWLATSVAGLIVGIFPGLIVSVTLWLRFQMLTTLFVMTFFYVLAIILAFSVVISRLSERNRKLAQEVALLNNRVERMESQQ